MIVPDTIDVHDVLARVHQRAPQNFYDDLVLIDAHGGLIGLIPMQSLVRLQHSLLARQINRHAIKASNWRARIRNWSA